MKFPIDAPRTVARRSVSVQKNHTGGTCLAGAQLLPQAGFAIGFSASPRSPALVVVWAITPANIPMPTAASVFTMANSMPSPAAVRMNISGSMIGEAMQKARTGAIGTPATSRLATSGITPQEQKGDSAPNSDAVKIAMAGRAVKALATILAAPAAFSPAAIATDARMMGGCP